MAIRNYSGKKYQTDSVEHTLDALTIEEALQIYINNAPFTVTMRTPGEDISLVRGLLHSEDIINDASYLPEIVLKKKDDKTIVTEAHLKLPKDKLGKGYTNSRSLMSVSSCGICGKTELDDVIPDDTIQSSSEQIDNYLIHGLFDKMNTYQHDFNRSGGTHAASAFTIDGDLLCAMEDVGRHNAVDKVIGKLILNDQLKKAKILTVSGRISYEITIKCFKAGIPFLAAVSAPSSLAVDYAKELGITLFAFCRDHRATCYANPYRIKNVNYSSTN
jgi:FdhD protein